MTALELSIPLGLGLVSSLHCVQMCGPIVLSYSMAGRGSKAGHVFYNTGRIMTYSALGAVAGSAGSAIGLLRVSGIQQIASVIAGCLMVIAGVFLSGALPAQSLVKIDRIGIARLFSRSVGRLMLSPSALSKFALGGILGFLPCGLLYAALLKAVATGSALDGALSMAAFGLGTAGALLGIGLFSSVLTPRLGRWSNAVASVCIVATGLYLVWRGVTVKVPGMTCHAGM